MLSTYIGRVDPAVAVVLVTYYGAKFLERLYGSLQRQRYPADRVQLIVVENGSDQAGARWFAAHAPHARVLVPGTNTGYAGGNSLGIAHALELGVDYVAVITQDTWLEPDWLPALVAVAEARPDAGAVQPKILRPDGAGGTVVHSRGNRLHFLGVGYVGGDGEADAPGRVESIGYASGAGVLYRARALREVGAFDPELFMYHEDSDLSWRLRLAGWDIVLAPDAVMHHEYAFTRGGGKFYFVERNRLVNVLTHYRLGTLALLSPALALFEPVTLAFAARGGWLSERLAVYGFFARPRSWRYLLRKRRSVQRLRRVPDRAIARHLSARFEFAPIAPPLVRRVLDPVLAAYWAVVRRLIVW
jgi:GT2 family glycosyltransferase